MLCRLGFCGLGTDVRGRELHCRLPVKSLVRLSNVAGLRRAYPYGQSGFGMAVNTLRLNQRSTF